MWQRVIFAYTPDSDCWNFSCLTLDGIYSLYITSTYMYILLSIWSIRGSQHCYATGSSEQISSGKAVAFRTCRLSIQLRVMNSKLRSVYSLQSGKTRDSSIGSWQMRLASDSLIPDGVGHVRSTCKGSDGRVTLGGRKAIRSSVMMTFVSVLYNTPSDQCR